MRMCIRLEEALKKSPFSRKIKKIKEEAPLILPKINAYFPTYTDHGVLHFVDKAQWGPFNKEFKYGYLVKSEKIKND